MAVPRKVVKVQVHDQPLKSAKVEEGATYGARVGVNLFDADGTLITSLTQVIRQVAQTIYTTGSTTVSWGSISGLLSSQADLVAALAAIQADADAAQADIDAHEIAVDPHPQYALNTDLAGYQPLDADLTAIAALGPPGADRILFWDHSALTWAYLSLGTNLSITGTTLDAAGGGGGGSGDAVVKSYTQAAHGLVIGQPVYWNGTLWVIADADSDATCARAFVSTVTDANTIVVTFLGRSTATAAEWLARTEEAANLVPNEFYYQSTVAGKITKNAPTTGFSQCVGWAESTTVFFVNPGPVFALAGASSQLPGSVIGFGYGESSTAVNDTTGFNWGSNTAPGITAGTDVGISVAYTPKLASSLLEIEFTPTYYTHSANGQTCGFFIFEDNTCIAAKFATAVDTATRTTNAPVVRRIKAAGSTSARTYTARFAIFPGTGTGYLNSLSGTNYFAATDLMTITVKEIKQ